MYFLLFCLLTVIDYFYLLDAFDWTIKHRSLSILIFWYLMHVGFFYFIFLPFNFVWGNQLLMISEQELERIYAVIMFAIYFYRTWQKTYIWVTRRVSYKKKELLTLCEHSGSLPVICVVHVAHIVSFLCCAVLWFVCLFVCFILFVFCFCFVLFLVFFPLSSSCVLYTQCYQNLWIVNSRLPWQFSITLILQYVIKTCEIALWQKATCLLKRTNYGKYQHYSANNVRDKEHLRKLYLR
jgi:hypothetical protein